MPPQLALAKAHPVEHIALSDNRNPHLAWSDLPAGTRSLALICVDPDVPSQPDNVNREGATVPADLPRVDFYHWALVNLAPDASPIGEGEFSKDVTPGGKRGPKGPRDTLQGLNGYTEWFAGDAEMTGEYYGYDGPCPPWNDEILHHYRFTLYALDIDRCPVVNGFGAEEVLQTIEDHVLDLASIVGSYATNPEAR